jgi:hypothetical protein
MDRNKCNLDVMCGYYNQPMDGEWSKSIIAYHITKSEHVASILENGLIAKECQATNYGEFRNKAVYLFASKADAYDKNIMDFLFGVADRLAIMEVSIPYDAYINLRDDGVFNMSCICSNGSYPTAVQYIDNIPSDWIKENRQEER